MANVIETNTRNNFTDQIILNIKNLNYFKQKIYDGFKDNLYFKNVELKSLFFRFMHTLGVGEFVKLFVYTNPQIKKIQKFIQIFS
jgi:hypothetical protein